MTARALFSITDEVLERFRALVPSSKRSQEIERLMREEISRRENQRELEIEQLARQVETDPAYADVRSVSSDTDAIAGEAVQ